MTYKKHRYKSVSKMHNNGKRLRDRLVETLHLWDTGEISEDEAIERIQSIKQQRRQRRSFVERAAKAIVA